MHSQIRSNDVVRHCLLCYEVYQKWPLLGPAPVEHRIPLQCIVERKASKSLKSSLVCLDYCRARDHRWLEVRRTLLPTVTQAKNYWQGPRCTRAKYSPHRTATLIFSKHLIVQRAQVRQSLHFTRQAQRGWRQGLEKRL